MLGDELASHIVPVDEAHYGDIGTAVGEDGTSSDALVMLVYNVQDDSYYDCGVTTYTAGYFAAAYIDEAGMNVIVVDAFDWANRIGEGCGRESPQLYEGVVAHELEHLLMNYSDPGEVSWVDEGLADMAMFLNGYDIGGSHLTYHQVFHRETSLTRWGGGLENYGASFTYFLYLWEQAGGNGDGTYNAEQSLRRGRRRPVNQADLPERRGRHGRGPGRDRPVQRDDSGANLRSAEELFKDWAVAVKLDDEGSNRFDIRNIDFGDPAFTSYTVDIANDVFWNKRGQYIGRDAEGAVGQSPEGAAAERAAVRGLVRDVPQPRTGVRGRLRGITEERVDRTPVAPTGGAVRRARTRTFSMLPALGSRRAQPWTSGPGTSSRKAGTTATSRHSSTTSGSPCPSTGTAPSRSHHRQQPHDNNEEGNGFTGTSGGAYFVDEPEYIHLESAPLPAGTTDVRFRYSTDAAYLDTGFFVDDVTVGGQAVTLASEPGHWIVTTVCRTTTGWCRS